jgi:shikimate dehydrogenase
MITAISAASPVCMIIGDPVEHSLSPRVHMAGYRAAALPFVMIGARVDRSKLADAFTGMRALGIRGVSITMPHKVESVHLVDEVDPVAQEIGAINTVVNVGSGRLVGYNTDWVGITTPLERLTALKGARVAVLGAGGAANAAVFAAIKKGAVVTVFNRTAAKGDTLAARWGCSASTLVENTELSQFDIIINATSVGMGALSGVSPLPQHQFLPNQIVFETIYSPLETQLLYDARQCNAQVVGGAEMFLEQALAQFELHTGTPAPRIEMERALKTALQEQR